MSTTNTIPSRVPVRARSLGTSRGSAPLVVPHAWHSAPLEEFAPIAAAGIAPLVEPSVVRSPPPSVVTERAASQGAPGTVLSVREFDRVLARERSLADRGTRRFCVLTLLRIAGPGEGWAGLARALRARLRSTDLVGRMDGERVAVLLSDTELDGANSVARWIDLYVARIGLRVRPTIYVYPLTTAEPSLRAPGPAVRAVERRAVPVAEPVPSEPPDGGRWPVADLGEQFSVPLPFAKRAVDLCVSAAALLLLAPLFAVVAVAIKLDSPGPVLFRQLRAGRGGRSFAFYKFRSMHADAEKRRAELEASNEKDGPIFKIRDDPRITRVGRVLRRWSLDELPQLWNIVKGDLSLVGPRSPTLNEVAEYERWQRRRLDVTGGLTCIWQVSGRSQVSFQEWMRMDMRYVRRRSSWLDFCLLARTLPAVLQGRGAY